MPRATSGDIQSISKLAIPLHQLYVNYFGPLPKTKNELIHIFVVVDAYSKYCFLYTFKNLKIDKIAECIVYIIYLVGTHSRIIVDNGTSLKAIQ